MGKKKPKIKTKPKPLRVAMVGGGVRYPADVVGRFQAGWEVWGLNAIYPPWSSHVRWARRFNLHLWDHLVRDWAAGLRSEIDHAKLRAEVPLYVLDAWRPGSIPNEKIFPGKELARMPFGSYHAGSFDWMVAYAIYLGAKEISIHGVNLALDSVREEPISARACLELWLGFAAGRGIKVHVSEDCDILRQYHLVRSGTIYGYDDVKLVEQGPVHAAQFQLLGVPSGLAKPERKKT